MTALLGNELGFPRYGPENTIHHAKADRALERVLIPSTESPDTISDGWPHLSLTEYGEKLIGAGQPLPYDPDGYIARLNAATGGLHRTVEVYLGEAISTFRTGNRIASPIMLGAASEMIFILLCASIAMALADGKKGQEFAKATSPDKNMKGRVKRVISWLNSKQSQLPNDWQDSERVQLVEKVAGLIRNWRNDAGHPQDPPVIRSHEEVYSLLVVFPDYCTKLYALIRLLDGRKGTIV